MKHVTCENIMDKEKTENEKQVIGRVGEETAARFLVKRGFFVIEKNYRKKWGEIDIIVKKGKEIRFVEVKTVSRENLEGFSRETLEGYRPEDNIHPWKLKRLGRAIQTYLAEHGLDESDWRFDVITVYLDLARKEAKVYLLEDVVL